MKIFPIVSDEEFSKAQDKRISLRGKGRSPKKYGYKLSGLIYCGECGGKFIGDSRKQKWKVKSGEYHEPKGKGVESHPCMKQNYLKKFNRY